MTTPNIIISLSLVTLLLLFLFRYGIKDEIRTLGYLICIIAAIAATVWYVNIKKERKNKYATYYTCLHTINYLTDKIKAYNFKYSTPLKEIDLKKLKEKKMIESDYDKDLDYIKTIHGCEYTNQGDLSDDGVIICKKHGDKKTVERELNKYK